MKQIFFITGIDTGVGKSVATGWLAKQYMESGYSVITQKFIQTGNKEVSEDIGTHRKIMGLPLQQPDIEGLTCPYILSYPASPHLAASIDNVEIDIRKITKSTDILSKDYDIVLLEGAGGLMVPVNKEYMTVDYVRDNKLPVIVVTSPKLGSLNHTLMTVNLCRNYNIQIDRIIYNRFGEYDALIAEDSFLFIKNYINKYTPDTALIELPKVDI